MKYSDGSKIEKRPSTKARTICMPGAKTEDVSKKLEELSKTHKIKKLMIHVGGNNIPNANPQILSEKLIGMLKHTQGIMPETVLQFSALLPRLGDNYLPGIFDVNRNVGEQPSL